MSVLPLHLELFIAAHDDEGNALIHLPSLGLGLAGAAVLELMLNERLLLDGARPVVKSGEPIADEIAAAVAQTIEHEPQPRPLAFWLRAIATTVYDRVGASLLSTGMLTVKNRRKLGLNKRVLVPASDLTLARIQTDLLHAFNGRRDPEPPLAMLCGLVAVLRLERTLEVYTGSGEAVARLKELSYAHFPEGRPVLATIEDLLGETAVAAYR